MPWGYAAAALVSAYGAHSQSQAGQNAADAQTDAARYATDEQRRQYDQTRSDMTPWMQAGGWALDEQQNFLRGDYRNALASPFYTAALEQGTAALDAGATANGNLFGGGADADRIQFGQQLATQHLGNYYNALAGLSNTGQTTAGQIGQFGANYASQAGRNAMYAGEAQASAYGNSANAWSNAGNNMLGLLWQGAGSDWNWGGG